MCECNTLTDLMLYNRKIKINIYSKQKIVYLPVVNKGKAKLFLEII